MTDEEVKGFVVISFSESRGEEKILRKVAQWLSFILGTPNEVQSKSCGNCINHCNVKILNLFDAELQVIKTKPVIKNK